MIRRVPELPVENRRKHAKMATAFLNIWAASLGMASDATLIATLNPGASPYCTTPCERYSAG